MSENLGWTFQRNRYREKTWIEREKVGDDRENSVKNVKKKSEIPITFELYLEFLILFFTKFTGFECKIHPAMIHDCIHGSYISYINRAGTFLVHSSGWIVDLGGSRYGCFLEQLALSHWWAGLGQVARCGQAPEGQQGGGIHNHAPCPWATSYSVASRFVA